MDDVSVTWRKASSSTANGGNCVEVGRIANSILIRDSKAPGAGHLTLSTDGFRSFVASLKEGRLNV
ncbi:DUF397 domain-containing protein [Thermopolyspora sp. NPDC052614]|uniref:DUF397 domain-containing protein n=1 Tax=Thermopolyspora sp. NPDC052614 TaxID=3155682 RepID=UPI003437865D